MSTDVENFGTRSRHGNPFEITKAVEFTDDQINRTWVDWPAPGGFAALMKVESPMPRIVLGGKGSGRTHVMRHFSAPVQAIRGKEDPAEQAAEDGVLGIYVRCSGLNSSRFQGRGQTNAAWQSVFAQYADLWLAQAALEAFATITEKSPASAQIQCAISEELRELVGNTALNSDKSLAALGEALYRIQREIDLAVNNAALSPGEPLKLTILTNPGDLVFAVPEAIRRHYERMSDVTFLYLIDEFENFEEQQQEYVNSLIREKRYGTSFMVGVRTFGLRTLKTLGGGEDNKRGSEFDEIVPDGNYRRHTRGEKENNWFDDFCREVIARRLSESRLVEDIWSEELGRRLDQFFFVPGSDYEEKLIIDRYGDEDRPYLTALKEQLTRSRGSGPVPLSDKDIDFIVNAVRVPSRPLLEKANILLIYRAWAAGNRLVETAQEVFAAQPANDSHGVVRPNKVQQSVLDYYASDLKAQLCLAAHSHPCYAGLNQFIAMSDGLPRNLLVILKNIYRWALFYGEEPFRGDPISLEAQRMGILEAAEWFISDARPLGGDGVDVVAAVRNLGDLFRQSRFSHKPAECSAASFSVDLSKCTERAREVITMAEQRALLVRVSQGQRHRNTGITESKFHMNRLLSPQWDLPVARRGTFGLNPDEVNAIFDPSQGQRLQHVLRERLRRMNTPFSQSGDSHEGQQSVLDLDLSEQEGE